MIELDDNQSVDNDSPAHTDPSPPIRYGREEKRSRKIEEINNAAAAVFIRDGYAEFSARKVAKEMGISLSNLQHYCGNTDNLCVQMVKDKLEYYIHRFEEVYRDKSLLPIERLAVAIRENVIATYDPYATRLFFQMAALATQDDRIKEVMVNQYEQFLSGLRSLVAEINPLLTHDQVATYSGLIATQIEGNFFYQWQPSFTPALREQMLEEFIVIWQRMLSSAVLTPNILGSHVEDL
ncbi:TetR/AcrR family transcriptional regulator [Pseudomonas sp. O230]|uniref:TetR/AcrR family transcriptional regulator n=1 Tax=Pseudomonas sp. O230 TaxID=3159450 RepID=UPI00387B1EFC